MKKPPLRQIFLKPLLIKTFSHTLQKHTEDLIIGLDEPWLVGIFLNVINEAKLIVMGIQIDVEIERLFRHGVIQRVFGDQDMSAKAVNLLFNGFLEPFHDEKRGHDSGQTDGDAGDSDLVGGG